MGTSLGGRQYSQNRPHLCLVALAGSSCFFLAKLMLLSILELISIAENFSLWSVLQCLENSSVLIRVLLNSQLGKRQESKEVAESELCPSTWVLMLTLMCGGTEGIGSYRSEHSQPLSEMLECLDYNLCSFFFFILFYQLCCFAKTLKAFACVAVQ